MFGVTTAPTWSGVAGYGNLRQTLNGLLVFLHGLAHLRVFNSVLQVHAMYCNGSMTFTEDLQGFKVTWRAAKKIANDC